MQGPRFTNVAKKKYENIPDKLYWRWIECAVDSDLDVEGVGPGFGGDPNVIGGSWREPENEMSPPDGPVATWACRLSPHGPVAASTIGIVSAASAASAVATGPVDICIRRGQ